MHGTKGLWWKLHFSVVGLFVVQDTETELGSTTTLIKETGGMLQCLDKLGYRGGKWLVIKLQVFVQMCIKIKSLYGP